MLILGVDPGNTTGLVVIHRDEDAHITVVETHQLGVKEATLWLRRDISYAGFDLVGMEKFIITPRTAKLSQQTDALEMIGVVKSLLLYKLTDQGGEIPLSMHTPADAKTVWSNDRLKKHDLYSTARGHARDALRHALLALERAGHSIS